VTSLVTSGLSGTPYQHSDIGGYNAMPLFGYVRTEQLFHRWAELAAFTTVMRTHDGSSPHENGQFYRTETTRARFARMTRVYRALYPVRARLVAEAAATGLPVVRALPLAFHPLDPTLLNETQQFMFGPFLVAPVTAPNATWWTVKLPFSPPGADPLPPSAPPTCWQHLWTDGNYSAPAGMAVLGADTPTPLSCPPVYFPCGDSEGTAVKAPSLTRA
jgi:alpha-glucosidase